MSEQKQTFIEQPVLAQAQIQNEQNVQWDDILREADNIWKSAKLQWKTEGLYKIYKQENISKNAQDRLNEIHDEYKKHHPQLFTSYPTVMLHMLKEQTYHQEAFKKYLKNLLNHPWKSDEDRLDSYADYAIYLYKAFNSKWDTTTVNDIRADYRQRIGNIHDSFKKEYERHKKDIESRDARFSLERREELKKILIKKALSGDTSIPIVTNEDIMEQLATKDVEVTQDKLREIVERMSALSECKE
jgi:hypothetical protein